MTNRLLRKKSKGRVMKVIAIFCMMMLVFQYAPVTVAARDLQEVQAEIDAKKAKLEEIESTIQANKNNKAAAESALVEYQAQLDQLYALIDEQEVLINNALSEFDFKSEQLSNTVESIRENEALYEERLIAIYELNSTNAIISTLLSVNSFAEFVQAADAIQRMSQKDTDLLNQLAKQKETYEAQKVDLEETIANLQAELENLRADRDWCGAKIEEMKNLIAAANYNIQLNEQEQDQTEEEIKALQEEYAKIFKQLQQKGSKAGDGSVRYDGPLLWPVAGHSRVSSWYGSPRSNTGSHYGIDIPASTGTPIQAAASGYVLTATWHYSYGYYIVLDHGQGLRTLYAHCSQLWVTVGNYVTTGQDIAAVGNTGNSFGAHLHFEVHEHGSRQNPAGANYLNIY